MSARATMYRLVAFASMVFAGATAAAQLNEHCTVSVLNRTAQVASDGRWYIPNIPSDQGLVRIRATCTENGITRTGASAFFRVPTNGEIGVPEIIFEDVPQIPATLKLSAGETTLGAIGDSTQLTVLLMNPDGGTRDVPRGADGTTYTTSNPRIVTISADGLVTAVGTGTAIVSAMHEGTLGLLRIAVTTGPLDTDRDGMPDDWELSAGLNPNNAADAAQDADGDGLTNLQEFQRQTDPRLADSDGDGVRDGLEVSTGSDPLDPASINLTAALAAIRTIPAAVVLPKNVIDTETKRRIGVEGVLRDGATIDLTARARGTSYTSSNLQIASFTAIDGELFGGTPGFATLTVTNSGLTATAPIVVTTFNPRRRSELSLPGYANDAEVLGNFCYVAGGVAGLVVVDVTDRMAPRAIGSVATGGSAWSVRIIGTRAFVADETGGLVIVDVSVPSQPTVLATVPIGGIAHDVAVSGNYAYVAADPAGLVVIDLTTAAVVGQLPLAAARGVDAGGTTVVVTGAQFGLAVIDVSTPAQPRLRGTAAGFFGEKVRLRGAAAFVAGRGFRLSVIDLSNPDAPQLVGRSSSSTGSPVDVALVDDWALTANASNAMAVPIIQAGTLSAPQHRASVPVGGFRSERWAMGIAADRSFVYETASTFDGKWSAGTTALFIGQWQPPVDDFGVAPAIRLSIASLERGTTATIPIEATDDIDVAAVVLIVDGQTVGVDTAPPYSFQVSVPTTATQMTTLRAIALDFGGNIGEVTSIVPVVPDTTAPVVTVLTPSAGQVLAGGTKIYVSLEATDAGPITQVEGLADNVSLGTSTSRFGTFEYVVPNANGTVTFGGRATDHAGNVGVASGVTVTTRRDDPPTVSMSISPAGLLFTGTELTVQVNASDDFGVTRIQLVVDGNVVREQNWPSTFRYTVPQSVSTLAVSVNAIDTRNQVGSTPAQTLTIEQTAALGTLDLTGYANDVALAGRHAYVAGGPAGVHVVDVNDPAAPALRATIDTPGVAAKVVVRGPFAFVADGAAGIQVLSVAAPDAPEIVATLRTGGDAHDLAYRNERLYVGTSAGFEIINVADPRAPQRITSRATQQPVTSVAVKDAMLFVAMAHPDPNLYYDHLVIAIDVANEQSPVTRGLVSVQSGGRWANLTVAGDRVYVATERELYALSATLNPTVLGSSPVYDDARGGYTDVAIDGTIAIAAAAENNYKDEAPLLTVAQPSGITHLGGISLGSFGPYEGTGVAADGQLAYLTGIDQSPAWVTLTSDVASRLYVARYRTRTDSAGVAPAVQLTTPASSTTVLPGRALRIGANASDDHGVRSVTFLVDGTAIAELTAPPYETIYVVPAGAASFTITATARDFDDNTATTSPVTVTVNADTAAPVVRLTAPAAGRSLPSLGITIAAEATDNSAIGSVEFLVDGQVASTDRSTPYGASHTLPPGTTRARVAARAFDVAGNSSTSAAIDVDVAPPVVLGSVPLPSFPRSLDVSGRYAFVAAETGLLVIDLINPAAPQLVGQLATTDEAWHVRVLGTYAYVTTRSGTLEVIDVSTPAAPVRLSTASGAFAVAVSRLRAVTKGEGGVTLRDITAPSISPSGSFVSTPVAVVDADDPMFIAANKGLRAYNGSTLLATRSVYPEWFSESINAVRLRGGYVAAALRGGVLWTNADEKFSWAASLDDGWFGDVDFLDDVLVAGRSDAGQVHLYDIADRRAPVARATIPFGTSSILSVRLTPTHLVVTTDQFGTTRLSVARYRTFTDSAGVAPVVTVTPFTGTAQVGRLLNLRASATDDVGVASVTFVVNGMDVFTDSVVPYEFNYLVPPNVSTLTVHARAVDYGGATQTSAARTISVSP